MKHLPKLKERQLQLKKQYKQLIEQAYNLRQTDPAESDFYEYEALKILDELNRLGYLQREGISKSIKISSQQI